MTLRRSNKIAWGRWVWYGWTFPQPRSSALHRWAEEPRAGWRGAKKIRKKVLSLAQNHRGPHGNSVTSPCSVSESPSGLERSQASSVLAFPPWKWRLSIQQSLVGPGHLTGRPHPCAGHCPTLLPHGSSGHCFWLHWDSGNKAEMEGSGWTRSVCLQGLLRSQLFLPPLQLQKARCRQQLRLSLLKHLGRPRAYLTKTSQGSNQLTSQGRLLSGCYRCQESRFKIPFVRAWNYL